MQEEVYRATTKGLIEGLISGYNATVFAYGPTGVCVCEGVCVLHRTYKVNEALCLNGAEIIIEARSRRNGRNNNM